MNTAIPALPLGNTSAELASRKGVAKQLVVDTTKNTLVVMDGVKNGGHPLAKAERRLVSSFSGLTLNGGSSADLSSDITLNLDVDKVLPPEFVELKTVVDAASEAGQLGDPVFLGEVDANTLTTSGNYMVNTVENTYENHWPMALSGSTPVRVLHRDNAVYQYIDYTQFTLVRRSIDSGSSWEKWILVNFSTGGLPHIYLSKNGDDNNLGLTSDTPVLTVGRAVAVANAVNSEKATRQVYFHFGAGDWGDVTFTNIPYSISITPYDGNNGTAYSEDLPKFGTLRGNFSNFSITGCVCDLLFLTDNSVCSIIGYNRINRYAVNNDSFLYVYSSFLELGTINPNTQPFIATSTGGLIYFAANVNTTFRLVDDITSTVGFIRVNGTGRLYLLSNFTFDFNGHTFTGNKIRISAGAHVDGMGSDPATYFNNFFGNGVLIENGAIINGVSTGNVNKAGDTITGALKYQATDYAAGQNPSVERYLVPVQFIDKNGKDLGYLSHTLYPNGDHNITVLCRNGLGSGTSFVLRLLADGRTWAEVPTPPLSHNITSIATTQWVNQKLGTGASVAALSALDESDPNYVETLEIKKLKAIAQINAEAQQAIYMGFSYEIGGQEYRIGYGFNDQCNLNGDAIIAMQNPGKVMPFRCMNEEGQTVWLDVPAETVLAIQEYGIVSHRDVIRKAADEKKARIMAAETEAEINAIVME